MAWRWIWHHINGTSPGSDDTVMTHHLRNHDRLHRHHHQRSAIFQRDHRNFLHRPKQKKYNETSPSLMYPFSHEGLAGLWSGTAPSLILVSNPIIQFVVYEALKQAAGRRHSQPQRQHITETGARRPDHRCTASVGGSSGVGGDKSRRPSVGLPSYEAFLLGATAKAVSTLVTYPLQLAQAKLRAGQAQAKVSRELRCGTASGLFCDSMTCCMHRSYICACCTNPQ